jgi:lysophospholipase L1-like esterase
MKLARAEVVSPRRRNRTRRLALVASALALVVGAGSVLASSPPHAAAVSRSVPGAIAAAAAGAATPAATATATATVGLARLDIPTPAYGPAQGPAPRTFVALGDSLTAWAFAPGSWYVHRSAAWPSVLSTMDPALTLLHNAGVPGNTTAQMVARFRADVLAYHPDLLIVLGGTNDVGKHWSGSVTVSNLRTIVRRAKAAGIDVVVMTIPPNNLLCPSELRALRNTNAALVSMAEAEGVPVVDIYATLVGSGGRLPRTYAAVDGLHLTESAEKAIAERVLTELGP